MVDFVSDMAGSVGEGLGNFSYGPHPSIIMWSNGPVDEQEEAEDEDGFFGATAKKLDSVLSSDVPESFNSFKFDAMVSESHMAETVVTKFPVSSGFLVSDHGINMNRVLVLEAVASNMQNSAMWMASVQGMSVITGAIFDNPVISVLGGVAGAVASAFETEDRIQSTYDLFNNLRATRTKLYISTILGPYLGCVITKLETKHDKDTQSILSLKITLEELQTIGTDSLADEAREAIASMYDYSDFAKIAVSVGLGMLGGAPLPGLGSSNETPSEQLSNLDKKLELLETPLSTVKGNIL
ncbi:tail protein [Proteus phage Myduc]|uniref:Dit-like phage tail protein N-terminal domain-containing protein n=1 Tax=Proteus phage Myduc TaxID=2650874 RepID=A0A5J6T7F5_9CAUD|nr:tail protein [Proteus phage Myduc]QFG06690.1 hypothetical protein CPT_Myduc_068 [Proteus phage Myduc]